MARKHVIYQSRQNRVRNRIRRLKKHLKCHHRDGDALKKLHHYLHDEVKPRNHHKIPAVGGVFVPFHVGGCLYDTENTRPHFPKG
jgi:hypothetical protein